MFERLREIRESRGCSQTTVAEIGGVSLRSQQEYEKGNVLPGADYLMKLHQAGFDIYYILTGVRNVSCLSTDEQELLHEWHHASLTRKQAAFNALTAKDMPLPGKSGNRYAQYGDKNMQNGNINYYIGKAEQNQIGNISNASIGSIRQGSNDD